MHVAAAASPVPLARGVRYLDRFCEYGPLASMYIPQRHITDRACSGLSVADPGGGGSWGAMDPPFPGQLY